MIGWDGMGETERSPPPPVTRKMDGREERKKERRKERRKVKRKGMDECKNGKIDKRRK